VTKKELIDKVAKDAGITKKAARQTIDSFNDCMKRALRNNFRVVLEDFGSFTPVADKKGDRVVKFRPYKKLRDAVGE
jgi:nucleoid DNA-binding protein